MVNVGPVGKYTLASTAPKIARANAPEILNTFVFMVPPFARASKLTSALAAHRVILGRPLGLSRPALQESAKQIRQPLLPAIFKVPRACVGVLVIQRPHDPLDVLFLDIECDLHAFISLRSRSKRDLIRSSRNSRVVHR
jgi:hypothetical protein